MPACPECPVGHGVVIRWYFSGTDTLNTNEQKYKSTYNYHYT